MNLIKRQKKKIIVYANYNKKIYTFIHPCTTEKLSSTSYLFHDEITKEYLYIKHLYTS